MADQPKHTYIQRFAFKSHVEIKASSPEDAAAQFGRMRDSALLEQMQFNGYDDLEVDEPELKEGKRR